MVKGPGEACKLGFGCDDFEGIVQSPHWNLERAAESARIKELEVVTEVIFIEMMLKTHDSIREEEDEMKRSQSPRWTV